MCVLKLLQQRAHINTGVRPGSLAAFIPQVRKGFFQKYHFEAYEFQAVSEKKRGRTYSILVQI